MARSPLAIVVARLKAWPRPYLKAHPGFGPFIVGVVSGVLTTLIANSIEALGPVLWPPESTAQIEQLIAEEARLVLESPRGAEAYAALFSEGAQIVNVQDPAIFKGRAAIVRRFLTLEEFDTVEHGLRAPPVIHGNSATAETLSTLEFDGQRHAGRELWWFVRVNGTWKIDRLRFNNPQ